MSTVNRTTPTDNGNRSVRVSRSKHITSLTILDHSDAFAALRGVSVFRNPSVMLDDDTAVAVAADILRAVTTAPGTKFGSLDDALALVKALAE